MVVSIRTLSTMVCASSAILGVKSFHSDLLVRRHEGWRGGRFGRKGTAGAFVGVAHLVPSASGSSSSSSTAQGRVGNATALEAPHPDRKAQSAPPILATEAATPVGNARDPRRTADRWYLDADGASLSVPSLVQENDRVVSSTPPKPPTVSQKVSLGSPSQLLAIPADQGRGAKDVPSLRSLVRSVNYFISRKCNYSCQFCFHTQKTTHHLTLGQAEIGLKLLKEAGCEKINFAGGEPFVHAELLGQLCQLSHEMGLAVSIISNGSLITDKWMVKYGQYVDVLGVSVDSFVPTTNANIGRGGDANNQHADRIINVRRLCAEHSIKFKMNTVVCSLNWREDMSARVLELAPDRWKVFQVLVLDHENAGGPGDLKDARPLQVTDDQYWSFVRRHQHQLSSLSSSLSNVLIPEPNDVMRDSYLLLDEDMRFLDCSSGAKIPGESILKVGVAKALTQAGFDHDMFVQRGGVYDWTRDRNAN